MSKPRLPPSDENWEEALEMKEKPFIDGPEGHIPPNDNTRIDRPPEKKTMSKPRLPPSDENWKEALEIQQKDWHGNNHPPPHRFEFGISSERWPGVSASEAARRRLVSTHETPETTKPPQQEAPSLPPATPLSPGHPFGKPS